MRPTITMLLAALLFNACASISSLQKVESKIPCIGAVGKEDKNLLKKEFKKIGEPHLKGAIAVSINSVSFTKNSYGLYKDHSERLGRETAITYIDSAEVKPRFYQMKITDLVGLKRQLNNEENRALVSYVMNDTKQKILTEISFVAEKQAARQIQEAEHLFVVRQNGMLTLEAHGEYGNTQIKMSALQVFDFKTSGFCWSNNTYGKPEIALIRTDGNSCPSATEKNPEKLSDTRAYLKF